ARSSGRPATSWPSPATTRSPPPDSPPSHGGQAEDTPGRQGRLQPHSPDGEPPRPAPVSRLSAAAGSCRQQPGGRPNKTERPHPRRRGRPIKHLVAGAAPRAPRTQVRLAALLPAPGRRGWPPGQKGQPPQPLNPPPRQPSTSLPPRPA